MNMPALVEKSPGGNKSRPLSNSEALLLDLPYSYARDQGVIICSMEDERATIAMREGADPSALLEVRRYLALPFDVELVDGQAFEKLLSAHYAMDGSAAAMAGDMALTGKGLDDIAGDIPSAEDLLDSADDAPTIRLINGIIAEAARQGASDIHI
ncbi:MAG: type II secretion system protein GspE, partial [Parasphingorhabdus sp.]